MPLEPGTWKLDLRQAVRPVLDSIGMRIRMANWDLGKLRKNREGKGTKFSFFSY